MGLKNQLESILADTYVKRVRAVDVALTNNADTYVTLLASKDDPNHDLISDGSNIAECETGSRIVDLDLKLMLWDATTDDRIEVALFRDKDAGLTTSLSVTNLFLSDYTATAQEVKSACMWYEMFLFGSSSDMKTTGPRIRHQAMARNKRMRENDLIKLLFSCDDGGATRKANIVGRITVAK